MLGCAFNGRFPTDNHRGVCRLPRSRDALFQGVHVRRDPGNAPCVAWNGHDPTLAREAPPGFTFAMLAPREIGQEGFREGKVVETALNTLLDVGKELEATTAVFVSPPELVQTRANKAAVKDFLQNVRNKFDRVVWEAPTTWDADDAASLAIDVKVIPARDPLAHGALNASVATTVSLALRGTRAVRGPGDRQAGRDRERSKEQGRHVRLHERRHVCRREALQKGNEAPLSSLELKEHKKRTTAEASCHRRRPSLIPLGTSSAISRRPPE